MAKRAHKTSRRRTRKFSGVPRVTKSHLGLGAALVGGAATVWLLIDAFGEHPALSAISLTGVVSAASMLIKE